MKNRRKEYEKQRNKKRLIDRRKAKLENEPPNISNNAKMIRKFMIETGVKGHWKDFVIITGTTMIDHIGDYPIPSTFEGTVLVHKKDLKNILPPEVARKFWHPKLGRAGCFVKPGTKKSLD